MGPASRRTWRTLSDQALVTYCSRGLKPRAEACRIPRSMREHPPGAIAERSGDAPELELLRLLEAHPEYSQRQMSNALGVSLGKAHYLLTGAARQRLGQGAELQPQRAQVALSVCADAERRAPAPEADPFVPGAERARVRPVAGADRRAARRTGGPDDAEERSRLLIATKASHGQEILDLRRRPPGHGGLCDLPAAGGGRL